MFLVVHVVVIGVLSFTSSQPEHNILSQSPLCCKLSLSEIKSLQEGNPNDKNGKKACEILEPSEISFRVTA
jgi:hypothetical protein